MRATGSRPRSFVRRYGSTSGSPSACAMAERGVTGSYDRSTLGEPFRTDEIAADLRKRRPKPHPTWHLDEVYLKIDGRMVYVWRAVDAEGEVLDVLVQSKRNKHAALKLMRKLLKKYAIVPERMVTDDLRSYSAAVWDLGIERHHEARAMEEQQSREFASADTATGAQDAAVQEPRVQPRNFFPHTPPSTILSTSNAISPRLKRTGRCALWR